MTLMPARFAAIIDDTEFAFAVARVRALETKLLDRQRYERMLDAASVEDVYKTLAETEYAEVLSGASDVHQFEDALTRELTRVYTYLGGFVKDRAVLDCLLIRHDFHNLKVLVKEALLDEPSAPGALYDAGTVAVTNLKDAVALVFSGENARIDSAYAKCINAARAAYEASSDPQAIDNVIDAAMYELGCEMAQQSQSDMLIQLWQAWADLANAKSFVRAAAFSREPEFLKKVFVPGGVVSPKALSDVYEPELGALEPLISIFQKTRYAQVVQDGFKDFAQKRSYALYEKLADNYIAKVLEPSKRVSMGFEPILAYLLAKENEMRNIRIIFTGKINRLPADAIRERLRDAYV